MKAALLVVLLAASQTYAHPGWGIGLNSRGDVFLSDIDNQKIWKWSPGGGAETAVAGVWTHHLFVDAADNLYYETEIYQGEWGNSFWRLSPDGNSTTLVSPTLDRDAYWGTHTGRRGGIDLLSRSAQNSQAQSGRPGRDPGGWSC